MGNRARHRRLTGPPANRSPRGKAPHEKQSGGSSPRVKKIELSNKVVQSKGKANRARTATTKHMIGGARRATAKKGTAQPATAAKRETLERRGTQARGHAEGSEGRRSRAEASRSIQINKQPTCRAFILTESPCAEASRTAARKRADATATRGGNPPDGRTRAAEASRRSNQRAAPSRWPYMDRSSDPAETNAKRRQGKEESRAKTRSTRPDATARKCAVTKP